MTRRRALIGLPLVVVVAVVGFFTVRTAVAEVYYVPSGALTPEIPQGSRVLVSKLTTTYEVGQIVAYHVDDKVHIGRVDGVEPDRLLVSRNNNLDIPVNIDNLIGRVVINTR